MLQNVLLYEPNPALFVPDDDALIFYRAITDFALKHLNKNKGKLFFEINEKLGTKFCCYLRAKDFIMYT